MDYAIRRSRAPIPKQVRAEVMERAKYICEDCGADAPLELHHLTYNFDIQGEPETIFGNERAHDLAALCRDCHRDRHTDPYTGEFEPDIDELTQRVDHFEHLLAKDD